MSEPQQSPGQEWCPYCCKWHFFAHTNKGYRACVYCDYAIFNENDNSESEKDKQREGNETI